MQGEYTGAIGKLCRTKKITETTKRLNTIRKDQ